MWTIYDSCDQPVDYVDLWGLLEFLWCGDEDCYCMPFEFLRSEKEKSP